MSHKSPSSGSSRQPHNLAYTVRLSHNSNYCCLLYSRMKPRSPWVPCAAVAADVCTAAADASQPAVPGWCGRWQGAAWVMGGGPARAQGVHRRRPHVGGCELVERKRHTLLSHHPARLPVLPIRIPGRCARPLRFAAPRCGAPAPRWRLLCGDSRSQCVGCVSPEPTR